MIVSGAFLAIFVKLFLGSAQYIVQKDVLHAKVTNSAGERVEFQREYFFTAANFVAMLLAVLPLIPGQWRALTKQRSSVDTTSNEYSWRLVVWSAFPGFLDVAAVLISMKATIFLPASVVVLLKATRVIFAAGLTSVMLNKRVLVHQWTGVVITCVALIPIFFESMEHASSEKTRLNEVLMKQGKKPKEAEVTTTAEVFQGIGLILAAELMRAVRFVSEEWLIKKQNMATEFLLISECSWGCMAAVLACVICDLAGGEQLAESWTMLKSSTSLQILFFIYCATSGICNIAGTFITKFLSSVVNALVSELRVVLVFVPNVIRYQIDKKNADLEARKVKGEPFDAWSALKILGFVLLVLGAYVYNGAVKLPCAALQPPTVLPSGAKDDAAVKGNLDLDQAESNNDSTPRQPAVVNAEV